VVSSLVEARGRHGGIVAAGLYIPRHRLFPMFFASSALYPLWRVKEGSPLLYYVCELNPFTHAVELARFALYCQINWISLAVVAGCTALFMVGAILAYDPSRGFLARRGEPGGGT
jgi:ABC-2 type transport system permease protein